MQKELEDRFGDIERRLGAIESGTTSRPKPFWSQPYMRFDRTLSIAAVILVIFTLGHVFVDTGDVPIWITLTFMVGVIVRRARRYNSRSARENEAASTEPKHS